MELIFEAVQGPFTGASAGATVARFDSSGGIIGRSPECQLVLDDADRTVSRQHAGIRRRGDRFVLEVLSQINPVLVNEQPHRQGESVELNDGDTLAVGPFTLRLKIQQAAAAKPEAVPAAMPEAAASADSQRALQILSQGLGFPLRANSAADAETKLRLYGEMLAEALEGLRRLMLQRAESKSELVPANRTIVVATDKNPIKHGATRQEC